LVAEYIVNELSDGRQDLNDHILNEMAKSSFRPAQNHLLMARLRVPQVWTTNYDPLIELPMAGDTPVAVDEDTVRRIASNQRAVINPAVAAKVPDTIIVDGRSVHRVPAHRPISRLDDLVEQALEAFNRVLAVDKTQSRRSGAFRRKTQSASLLSTSARARSLRRLSFSAWSNSSSGATPPQPCLSSSLRYPARSTSLC
jgi:hypothetical protein